MLAEGDAFDQVLGAVGVGAGAAVERDPVLGLAVAADAVPGGAVPVEKLAAVLEDGGGALPAGRQHGVLGRAAGDDGGDFSEGGSVLHVITLSEDISHGDAATLTEQFWLHVAKGKAPSDALTLALERWAPAVSEYVVRHW